MTGKAPLIFKIFLLLSLTAPVVSQDRHQITVAAILDGVEVQHWNWLVSTGSNFLTSGGGPVLINAGSVTGQVSRLEGVRSYARRSRLDADLIFVVVASKERSRWYAQKVCRSPSAIACTAPELQTGYLLFARNSYDVSTFLHEIGHNFGLADNKDGRDVMYWVASHGTRLTRNYVNLADQFANGGRSSARLMACTGRRDLEQ